MSFPAFAVLGIQANCTHGLPQPKTGFQKLFSGTDMIVNVCLWVSAPSFPIYSQILL